VGGLGHGSVVYFANGLECRALVFGGTGFFGVISFAIFPTLFRAAADLAGLSFLP